MTKDIEMFELVKQWKQSNQTKTEFLKDKSITRDKLGYWLNKYNKQNANGAKSSGNIKKSSAFKEVDFSAYSSFVDPTKLIEVTTPLGFKITIFS